MSKLTAFVCSIVILGAAPTFVSAESRERAVWSEPFVVRDVVAAALEIETRFAGARAAALERLMANPDDLQGARLDIAVLQMVSWPYATCTTASGLVPPPMEGWGMASHTPFGEWPLSEERARVVFTYYDPSLPPETPEFNASSQSVSIHVSANPAQVQGAETFLQMTEVRDIMFKPGPYNYPVDRHAGNVLLGPYYVQINATTPEAELHYLTEIIGCALKNGLIAKGVDPDRLEKP